MKKAAIIVLAFVVSLWSANTATRALSPRPAILTSRVTLYSIIKHRGERRNFCLNFQTGASPSTREPCDLRYGWLNAGDELDWFQSSGNQRSVIKDLGLLNWTDEFQVPIVEPFPKLKPGEQRHISIDVSGADGADGAPGPDADGVVRSKPREVTNPAMRPTTPSRPKHDGKPKVDSLFVKAVLDHLYVIHVVDDTSDFYALFRVEALERGDNCTISWELIPAPEANPSSKQR